MKRVIKLTESQLTNIIKKVIEEQENVKGNLSDTVALLNGKTMKVLGLKGEYRLMKVLSSKLYPLPQPDGTRDIRLLLGEIDQYGTFISDVNYNIEMHLNCNQATIDYPLLDVKTILGSNNKKQKVDQTKTPMFQKLKTWLNQNGFCKTIDKVKPDFGKLNRPTNPDMGVA